MLPKLLAAIEFKCNNTAYRPVMDALDLLARYADVPNKVKHYDATAGEVPVKGVVPDGWLQMRDPAWWGNGTACASDAKKFGSWSSNLRTEYHVRYGGHGVMIYWHVEKRSVCVYSQLKSCSASEVSAMIEGPRSPRDRPGHRQRWAVAS